MESEELTSKRTAVEIKVRFLYDISGYCLDVFCMEKGQRLCRMDNRFKGKDVAAWYTITSEDEPDCPIRTDLIIQITGKGGSIVVSEQNNKCEGEFFAEKQFPFSWEKPKDQKAIELYVAIYTKE